MLQQDAAIEIEFHFEVNLTCALPAKSIEFVFKESCDNEVVQPS